jgi:hypothetical protein
MNAHHATALTYHCRLAVETTHPRFARRIRGGFGVILTVNSGYE